MIFKIYTFNMIVILCSLASGCGDLIKARNPTKRMDIPEPETKSSEIYGQCVNFQGNWTVQCPTPSPDLPSSFYLVQQSCDLFILQNTFLSFEREAVTWSNGRDALFLKSEGGILLFQKQGLVRDGTWTHRQQSCRLSWAP